jgi:hypothetical protein
MATHEFVCRWPRFVSLYVNDYCPVRKQEERATTFWMAVVLSIVQLLTLAMVLNSVCHSAEIVVMVRFWDRPTPKSNRSLGPRPQAEGANVRQLDGWVGAVVKPVALQQLVVGT